MFIDVAEKDVSYGFIVRVIVFIHCAIQKESYTEKNVSGSNKRKMKLNGNEKIPELPQIITSCRLSLLELEFLFRRIGASRAFRLAALSPKVVC